MKVGDLVELSARGKKLLNFQWLYGCHGIVIKRVHELSYWKVHWFGKPAAVMNRREIKHLTSKNK